MVSDTTRMVREFHGALKVPVLDKPQLPADRIDLRVELIREEFEELKVALAENDMVETADALADLIYVIYGAALEFGIPIDTVLREVHRSNMTKFEGTPNIREDGKVMKGDKFEPPQIEAILNKWGWSRD